MLCLNSSIIISDLSPQLSFSGILASVLVLRTTLTSLEKTYLLKFKVTAVWLNPERIGKVTLTNDRDYYVLMHGRLIYLCAFIK